MGKRVFIYCFVQIFNLNLTARPGQTPFSVQLHEQKIMLNVTEMNTLIMIAVNAHFLRDK